MRCQSLAFFHEFFFHPWFFFGPTSRALRSFNLLFLIAEAEGKTEEEEEVVAEGEKSLLIEGGGGGGDDIALAKKSSGRLGGFSLARSSESLLVYHAGSPCPSVPI